MKLSTKIALCATATLLSVQANAQYSDTRGRDSRVRCHSMRNDFVLNKANVNALVAMSCAALSHTENERRQMTIEDGMTTFHQWSTTGNGNSIKVEGYCAVPLTALEEDKISRHKIKLNFTRIQDNTSKMIVKVEGSIAGKAMGLEFSNNKFFDNQCPNGINTPNSLAMIDLGLGFGVPSIQTMVDMIRSQRMGVSMQSYEKDSWVQGQASGYFSGLGLMYSINQWGRKLGIAAAPSGSGGLLHIRTANILDWAEGSDYFAMKKDSFDLPTGFAHESKRVRKYDSRTGRSYEEEVNSNNHKFQSYSIDGGAAMVGCSSLVYDGELSKSQEVDLYQCKQALSKSSLGKLAGVEVAVRQSKEEAEAARIRIAQAEMIRKVETYIAKNYLPAGQYTSGPGVYEQGKKTWTSADRERGYVVVQRTYDIDVKAGVVMVTEHMMNSASQIRIKKTQFPLKTLQ